MKVILYARVSTEEQAREGVSIDNQLEKMNVYCNLYGHEIVETVIDAGQTAKTVQRDGMQRIIELARKRKPGFDGVVVLKLDRLFRNCEEALRYSAKWDKKGIALISVQEQLDTKSASGRLFFTLLAAMAEWERATIAERTSAALQFKKDRKEKTGGAVPYGYDVAEVQGVKMLVENEAEQEVLEQIHGLRKNKASLRKIACELNAKGIPTKNAQSKWHPEVIRKILAH